jgi:hypothetical protein
MVAFNTLLCLLGLTALEGLANPIGIASILTYSYFRYTAQVAKSQFSSYAWKHSSSQRIRC